MIEKVTRSRGHKFQKNKTKSKVAKIFLASREIQWLTVWSFRLICLQVSGHQRNACNWTFPKCPRPWRGPRPGYTSKRHSLSPPPIFASGRLDPLFVSVQGSRWFCPVRVLTWISAARLLIRHLGPRKTIWICNVVSVLNLCIRWPAKVLFTGSSCQTVPVQTCQCWSECLLMSMVTEAPEEYPAAGFLD